MDDILQDGLVTRQSFQKKLVAYRLELQHFLTQEEWDAVVVKGIDLRKKELRKIDNPRGSLTKRPTRSWLL